MDDQVASQQQDVLRPIRMFVGALQGALGSDQSYASTDASVYNPPRQFVVVGPQGQTAVEGQPIITAGAGGFTLSPMGMVIALGVAYLVFRKKG